MGNCAFCDIVSGRSEAAVVFEDEVSLGFLDRRPLFPGHVLLVPREHHVTLMDLPVELVGPLFANAQQIARALELGLGAEGVFMGNNNRISQSVPHLHLHIVPRHKGDGLKGFFWPRRNYDSAAAMEETAERIRQALKALQEAQ
jgi:histidine triad (HIT) family protein